MEILEEKFPAGMRVLAVDDNSTCLMILAALLRKCQYKVTTANQAVKALQILRENKNEFDLVISDIDMPDMDGFMLLQQLQVGLQMDIPVLLLSAHDDKEVVMKGITHGACHCLLKPIRIEELKNIWQHVVIRKLDPRQQVVVLKGTQFNVDHINGKPNKKRKDENKEYDDDDDQLEKRQHDEYEADPSSSTPRNKKPRVVWLPVLHRKFVAAVNQLGLDKAVPKRILELMNVENITRENVASHLQKYRMYLKKFNSHVPISPQANMFADFGSGGYGQLVAAGLEINTQMTAGAALQCIEGDGGYTSYPVAATHVLSSTPASHECGACSDITPIAAEFSSINFDANSCYFADNNLMMLDEHLLNAPQQEVSAGNLSSEYSLTSHSLPTLPKFDGYSDNSPTVLPFESFYYNEHGPSVDLRDNMATSSAAATAHGDQSTSTFF